MAPGAGTRRSAPAATRLGLHSVGGRVGNASPVRFGHTGQALSQPEHHRAASGSRGFASVERVPGLGVVPTALMGRAAGDGRHATRGAPRLLIGTLPREPEGLKKRMRSNLAVGLPT